MTTSTSGPGGAPGVVLPASGSEPTTPGPEQFFGEDAEMRYLVERWDDGSLDLMTRPIGGARWSAPVRLVAG